MNPIRDILVHVDAGGSFRSRLRVAHACASSIDAGIVALYAVTPASLAKSLVFTAGFPDPSLIAYDDARLDHARKRVADACRELGAQVEWREALDERDFTRQALYADLVVLGHYDAAHREAGVSPGFVPSTLIDSGRPGLLVPEAAHCDGPFHRILIAWKESREAARALAAAMPFLVKADTVHLAVDAAVAEAQRVRLRGYLKRHGVDAQLSVVASAGGDTGDTLLAMAADVDADLMVMGCYGHSRGREWILGGTTRTIMRSMARPVLMAH